MIARLLRAIIPKRFRPIGYLEHLAQLRTEGRVLAGPFAGMRYVNGAVGSAYIPKLLGIYEREICSCVEDACAKGFSFVIDIGAAEGYYAVGLARRLPEAWVMAFEMEDQGRTMLAEMSRINNVADRVEIRGKCEPQDLKQALETEPHALIVCDAEGSEEYLLHPTEVPALRRTHLLVETHEFIIPGITETLVQRFAGTHEVQRIWQEDRHESDFPWRTLGTALLPRRYRDWAVSEWRPARMSWLWMVPRSS